MDSTLRSNHYPYLRSDIWYCVRRLPKAVWHVESRSTIYRFLVTDRRKSIVALSSFAAVYFYGRFSPSKL